MQNYLQKNYRKNNMRHAEGKVIAATDNACELPDKWKKIFQGRTPHYHKMTNFAKILSFRHDFHGNDVILQAEMNF